MRKILFAIGLLSVLSLSGCWTITYYIPGSVTDNKVAKVTEGDVTNVEEGTTTGIAGVAKSGGIQKIATVDYRVVEKHSVWAMIGSKGATSLDSRNSTIIVSGE
jgi:hypothetical protein